MTTEPRVLVATILCSYKMPTFWPTLDRLADLDYSNYEIYLNIELGAPDENIDAICEKLAASSRKHYIDKWWWKSSAHPTRGGDQDQGYRLPRIVAARNMVMDFAITTKPDKILLIDSDVVPPRDCIKKLLAVPYKIVGGMVPGRGEHKHVWYTGSRSKDLGPNLLEVDYSTAGFIMLDPEVYSCIGWRWGCVVGVKGQHSEDPIFGYEVLRNELGPWVVCTDVITEHNGPLHGSEAIENYKGVHHESS